MMRLRSTRRGGQAILVSGLLWAAAAGWLFGSNGWGSIPAVRAACGSPPDIRFAPAPDATRAFFDNCRHIGGLAAYRHLQVLDLAYPTIVATFLAAVMIGLTRSGSRLRLLAALPVAASVGDYLENAAAWVLLDGSGNAWAPSLLQAGSLGKTVLSWASWLTMLTLLALAIRRGCPAGTSPARPTPG